MTTQTIKNRVAEYKQDIAELERIVKQWAEDFKIKEVSKLASACYEAFNNLQMSLSKVNDLEEKKKYDMQCYKETYQFLVFVENKADIDLCVLLMNKSESFSNLITHYSKYCSNMEQKYKIELGSEKSFEAFYQAPPRIKTVRRK